MADDGKRHLGDASETAFGVATETGFPILSIVLVEPLFDGVFQICANFRASDGLPNLSAASRMQLRKLVFDIRWSTVSDLSPCAACLRFAAATRSSSFSDAARVSAM